jgi:hypothetical protein
MRKTVYVIMAVVAVAASAIGSASAAPGDTYKTKKAACEARAKNMKFGIHFVKKNRWVKDCIAGKHPA